MRERPTTGRRERREPRDYKGDQEGGRTRIFRKKVCRFCTDRVQLIDFKEADVLKKFLTEKGKIIPRRITGACAKHQRILARAIKRARHSGFLAFQTEQ